MNGIPPNASTAVPPGYHRPSTGLATTTPNTPRAVVAPHAGGSPAGASTHQHKHQEIIMETRSVTLFPEPRPARLPTAGKAI